MSYELAFLDEALKEWRTLGATIRDQFKARLIERLENPKIPSARLHGTKERYKIKLRGAGYRLVHEVRDGELVALGEERPCDQRPREIAEPRIA